MALYEIEIGYGDKEGEMKASRVIEYGFEIG
jgi:hypothetical protein